MEAVQLFEIYRVCNLKPSQITMTRNNDDLGLFLYSTFRFWLDSERGNGFLSHTVLLSSSEVCILLSRQLVHIGTFFWEGHRTQYGKKTFTETKFNIRIYENVSLWVVCSTQNTVLQKTEKEANINFVAFTAPLKTAMKLLCFSCYKI